MSRLEVKEINDSATCCSIVQVWVPLTNPSPRNGNPNNAGEVEISIEIMHKTIAEDRPAGHGQEEPNQYPHLDPPHRIHFDPFSPFSMFKNLVGPTIFMNCWKMICCFVLVILCVWMVPLTASSVLANLITGSGD